MKRGALKFSGQLLAPLAIALSLTAARTARAAPPSADLMKKLSAHAAGFEKMKKHASYAVAGKLEGLSRDATTAESVKQMQARVVADGTKVRFDIVHYEEDGADKTEEAKKKQREREAERAKKNEPKKDFHMPFLDTELAHYDFDQSEVDPADPNRVKITFVPKQRAETTIEGSAWVDAAQGTVLSAGFKMSKTPAFVDYVHITVEFGAPTALGPAVSRVHLDGKGGILFWAKLFRLDANITNYAIVP